MSKFTIITDSSADLAPALLQEYDIACIQLEVSLEGHAPCSNNQIDTADFYAALRAKKSATTSAVSPGTFRDIFKGYLDRGEDVLYIGFSSGLSSTYNAGFIAARELQQEYPDRKIMAVDTLAAALGQGLLVLLAAKKRAAGASLEETRQYIKDIRLNLAHWFTVDDLFFLKRGGRVSAATALAGTILQFKPVLHVDNAGHLINVDKVRGRRASLDALFNRMKESMLDTPDQIVGVSHGDAPADAEYLVNRIRTELGIETIFTDYIGPVIGAHSGPGTVALFFLGSKR